MAWLLYCAVFPNGKRYFGVTGRSLEARIKDHRDNLRNPKLPFHRALKKYDGNVVFRTVVVGEKKQILNLEIESIASFKTMDRRFGYNVSLGGDLSPMLVPEIVERMRATNTGRTLTPEHRALLSAKWKPKPPEVNAKISAALKGRKKSAEACANMSAAHKGKKQDLAVVARRAATMTGRKRPPEVCAKISSFHKGRPHTPEQIAKFIVSRTGVKHSEETKARMSAAHRGSKRSEETRAKMSARLAGNSRAKGFKHSPETIAKRLETLRRKREARNVDARLHNRPDGNT